MKFKLSIVLIVSCIIFVACYKTPEYPIEPQIEFVTYSAQQPYTIPDTAFLRISFTDGDGDLGKINNADSSSRIFIRDVKYSLDKVPQAIPVIPQKGTTKAISGTIDIKLAGTGGVGLFDGSSCLLYQHPFDTLTFEIYIQDRAGHISNKIITPPLVVRCP